jgi:hypothetical protein
MLPPQSVRRTLIFCAIATAFCSAVFGQGVSPQGSEFPLSGPLGGDQVRPSLGLNSAGGWLVWQGGRIDTNGQGIAALKLDSGFYAENSAIRVNQEQRGHQQNPHVAVLSDGGAAVIWSSAWKDKKGRGTNGIFARFLGADGTFKTGDVLVNQVSRRILTNYSQTLPGYKNNKMASRKFRFSETFRIYRGLNEGASIAALPDGGAVVVYSGLRRSITNSQQIVREVKVIRGKSYTNDVVRSTTTTGNWQKDVFFQRFDATGKKVGGELVVNQFAQLDQHQPVVTALPNGNFVVAYVSERTVLRVFGETFYRIDRPAPVPRVDINARIFDSTGAPVGGEFTVNTGSVPCAAPAIAAGADGAFTIAWVQTDALKANTVDVYARTFNADGSSTFDAFLVNVQQRGAQHTPRVAALGAVQMIVWNSRGQDGSGEGVFGRLISAGAPAGGEFQVNTITEGPQLHPAIAADGVNRFLVAWSGFELDSSFDLFAQTYIVTQPTPSGANLVEQNNSRAATQVSGGAGSVAGVGVSAAMTAGGTIGLPRLMVSGSAGRLSLQWTAQSGARYQVERSGDLRAWAPVGGARTAVNENEALEIDARDAGAAFFRVLRLP